MHLATIYLTTYWTKITVKIWDLTQGRHTHHVLWQPFWPASASFGACICSFPLLCCYVVTCDFHLCGRIINFWDRSMFLLGIMNVLGPITWTTIIGFLWYAVPVKNHICCLTDGGTCWWSKIGAEIIPYENTITRLITKSICQLTLFGSVGSCWSRRILMVMYPHKIAPRRLAHKWL